MIVQGPTAIVSSWAPNVKKNDPGRVHWKPRARVLADTPVPGMMGALLGHYRDSLRLIVASLGCPVTRQKE